MKAATIAAVGIECRNAAFRVFHLMPIGVFHLLPSFTCFAPCFQVESSMILCPVPHQAYAKRPCVSKCMLPITICQLGIRPPS
jgi:hypothetical protein